jgi:thiamine pyrophosphokinase
MRKICYIVGAGNSGGMSISPQKEDFVIAADGGYAALCKLGVRPDLAVGDFDSLGYLPDNVECLRHPPEKDDTDMMLAINEGIARGYDSFIIHGGLGGRLDHSLANLQSLCAVSNSGGRAWLWGEGQALTAVTNGKIVFPGKCSGMFSVFAQGGMARGVWERGSKYTLSDAELRFDYPMGVSNEFLGRETEVSVARGTLAVLWNCAAEEMEQMIKDGFC